MEPADLVWVAGEGATVRESAVALLPQLGSLATVTRLRAAHPDVPPDRIAAACTVAAAATSHADKLGPGAHALVITDTLAQQATHWAVADYRARELRARDVLCVLDATAGAGLDARAFVAAGLRTTAIERDAESFECLRANVPEARVLHGDSTELIARLLVEAPCTVFVDPARRDPHGPRRGDGARAHAERDPERWSPAWSWVCDLGTHASVVAKVAPGIPLSLVPPNASVEWIGIGSELVEACVWFGALRDDWARRATVLGADGESDSIDDTHAAASTVAPIGEWLIEPHDAVIRAGLVDALATRHGLGRVSDSSTWLTGPAPVHTALARNWRVESVAPVSDLRNATREFSTVVYKTSDIDRAAESVAASVRHRASRSARGTGFVVLMRGLDVAAIVQPAEARHRSL